MKIFKAIIYGIAVICWGISLIILLPPAIIFYSTSLVLEKKI